MWRVIKAEMSYNVVLFIFYLLMTVGVAFLERQLEDGGRFYVALLLFLVVQNWLSFKAKSKRDIFFARLPLSKMALGGVRIAMILVSAILIVLVYKCMHVLLGIHGHANYPVTNWKLVNSCSIVLFFFSLYFILSDTVALRLRKLPNFEVIKERSLLILVLLGVMLQILGLVAFLTKAPNIVTDLFDLFYYSNPFGIVRNIQIFLFISLFFAGISLVTYSKRRDYIL